MRGHITPEDLQACFEGRDAETLKQVRLILWRRICAVIIDQTLREDAMSNAQAKVYRIVAQGLGPHTSPRAWLRTVAFSCAVDVLRRELRRLEVERIAREGGSTGREPSDIHEVKRLMDGLSPLEGRIASIHILVLKARYEESLSIEAIAERLGVSQNTIKSRLLRARESLVDKAKAMPALDETVTLIESRRRRP